MQRRLYELCGVVSIGLHIQDGVIGRNCTYSEHFLWLQIPHTKTVLASIYRCEKRLMQDWIRTRDTVRRDITSTCKFSRSAYRNLQF